MSKKIDKLSDVKNYVDFIDYLTFDSQKIAFPAFMQFVHPDKSKREESKKIENEFEKKINKYFKNKNLYDLLIKNPPTEPLWLKSYHKTLKAFKKSGVLMSESDKIELEEIENKMIKLNTEFGKNITEKIAIIDVKPSDIPELEKLEITIIKDSKIKLTPQTKSAILKNHSSHDLRHKTYVMSSRASIDNIEIAKNIVKLRNKIAEKMKYKSFADFVLEENSLNSYKKVEDFLNDIHKEIKKDIDKEIGNIANSLKIKKEDILRVENMHYYIEQYKKKMDVDLRSYRKHFPVEHVLDKMFEIYEEFFDISFDLGEPAKTDPYWHSSVKKLKIFDKSENILGYIYLDLYYRDNKYSHPSNYPLIRRHKYSWEVKQLPICCLLMAIEDEFMMHDQVTTLFHEFGHAIHDVINAIELSTMGGTQMESDLVEVPSMFLEYMCWDSQILKKITKPSLSDDQIKALVKTKKVGKSLYWMRQLGYSILDQKIHHGANIDECDKIYAEITGFIDEPYDGKKAMMLGRFPHFSGYECQYYTYLYSQSYASQIYKLLLGKKNKLLDILEDDHKKYIEFLKYSSGETLKKLFGSLDTKYFIDDML